MWVSDSSSTIRDEDGTARYIQGVMLDITRGEGSRAAMEHLAHHDHLTGLPNRAMFEEHLTLALLASELGTAAVAVLFLDLDEFKPVNDVHGHGPGTRC